MRVNELKQGEKDAAGIIVADIYAINVPFYAVYRTNARVMVHFADEQTLAELQRQRLGALAALRGQINSLIDGWHNSKDMELKDKAKHLDRRVADALITALEGDVTNASELLAEIRNEVTADRKSRARFLYLLSASIASLILSLVLIIVGLIRPSMIIGYGVAGGILGAFFSISLGIRSRTIRTDLHWRDNASDAVLRIIVGTIASFVIVCLYRMGFVNWLRFPEAIPYWMPNFVLGFIGGFSERMIPDLLNKVESGGINAAKGQDAAVTTSKGPLNTTGADAVKEMTTQTKTKPDEEEAVDCCLCDAPPVEGEVITPDSELPAATGGVTNENVAPSLSPQITGR